MKKWLIALLLLAASTFSVQMARADKMSHKEYASTPLADCNSCHKGEGVAPNHDADWLRGHRVLASKAGNNCYQCHTQQFCLDCHKGGGIDANLSTRNYQRDYVPKSHRTDFINIHPIKALDNPQSCNRCHEPSYCNQCHSRFPKGSLRIKSHLRSGTTQSYIWNSEHATEARRNLQSCQTCHPDGDVCIKCHATSGKGGSGINPHPRNFKGGNIIDRSDRSCRKCHTL
ncbi:cytochrome C [Geobacter hydrogenophilus]|uniref:Cytochrome c n=1 Tax=Geobacter hydrogenophilus TaxID=40983 RepID=A0A9W6FYB3_9BACT|nr:cytochrome C [Geobacter hydrogenophilus]GLI37131.1 cytochrome c [Geobacter hydrogenophilus]